MESLSIAVECSRAESRNTDWTVAASVNVHVTSLQLQSLKIQRVTFDGVASPERWILRRQREECKRFDGLTIFGGVVKRIVDI